jgi:hypothetical protein
VESLDSIQQLEELFNIKIKYSEFAYPITELKELKEVDPFADVEFYPIGQYGAASLKHNLASLYVETENGTKTINASIEMPQNNGSLKNGDLIHVYYNAADYEYLSYEYGIKLTRTEADVPLSGVNGDPSYVKGEPLVIDLADYVSFHESGMNGSGQLYVEIDYATLILDCRHYKNQNVSDEYMRGHLFVLDAVREYFLHRGLDVYRIVSSSHQHNAARDWENKYEKLSNGETICFTWEAVDEGLKTFQMLLNVEFQNSDFSYTMQNLEEI